MPRSLADGKTKFTLLTEKPADPAKPTALELNGGIQADGSILASDFTWGATDSDTVAEKSLRDKNNANSLGASNYQAGVTPFRYFDDETGAVDATEDTVFAALREKGTQLWGYARRTGKDAEEPWAADDEIFLGAEVITDEPQPPSDLGGYTKFRVPMQVQKAYPFIAVAAGA
jgi:hypothetical protein